ncbi:tyrosine-type recombinase/integrase [Priestia megaterium]|uniref:tyrosine-type recombinase/integrase n=2 Tax=Priestia megaterium TaxID=1404 RepID=UPI003009B0AF
MITKKKIISSQHNVQISIDKKNTFQNNLKEYKELYREYVEQGKIISSSFDVSNWIILDKYLNRRKLRFPKHNLTNALKAYILLKIEEKVNFSNIHQGLSLLNKAIELSKKFDISQLDIFHEEIGCLKFQTRTRLSLYVINFLNFIDHPQKERFKNAVKPFIKYDFNSRKLPPYKDVLLFDEVMQNFMNTSSEEDKMKYYPVILWWNLTTILPLRPIEFCTLKYDCVEKDGDRYLITIPRKKQKYESFSDIDIENTFEINIRIFNLIKNYQDNTKERQSDFKYLFTYETYSTFYSHARPEKYTRNPDIFLNSSFEVILRHFYKHVVKNNDNNLNIERILPGDTRHFAICNMMLQGFNMLSIAKLAGHRRIAAQRTYWNHIDYFVQSYVYVLSQDSKINKSDMRTSFSLIDKLKKVKIYQKEDFSNFKEVEYGYCTDSEFPLNCTECAHCEFFYFYPEDYNKGIKWLTEESNNLDIKITQNVNYLRGLFKNIQSKIHFKTGAYSLIDQEEINSATNSIKHLSRRKALIDSLIPNFTGDDKNDK